MAQNLNLQVIAEGIETTEQLKELAELGCGFGQGYLFSRPLDAMLAEEFIRSQLPFPGYQTITDQSSNRHKGLSG